MLKKSSFECYTDDSSDSEYELDESDIPKKNTHQSAIALG